MRYAGTDRDDEGPWFRLGQVEVTTTMAVIVLWVLALIVWALEPVDKPLTRLLVLDGAQAGAGELWRTATWPWARIEFSVWTVIDATLFWFFGQQLERTVRRAPMAALLSAATLSVGFAAAAYSVILPGNTFIVDLRLLEICVVLLYCAEYPRVVFFFGIPAWAIGALIVAVEVINDVSYREWIRLLAVLTAAVVVTLVARYIGLLSAHQRIPNLGDRPSRASRPARTAKAKRKPSAKGGLASKLGRQPEAEIVEMPTAPRRSVPPVVVPDTVNADDLALDALLDKISAGGMDALTDDERRQLNEIRARRSSTD